jgi:hypothetical protein
VTIGKSFVEQQWKSSKKFIYAPRPLRMLHRVTDKAHPEARQSIMIPVRGAARNSKLLDFTSNNLLSVILSMAGEDEPSKTEMTPVTKLFAWKIRIVEEAEKLAVIHRTSASRMLLRGINYLLDRQEPLSHE